MSDTRPYPKILRTTVEADRDLRAYAAEYEIKPFEALVVAIDRLRDPVESESLRASLDAAGKLAERLAADLESAREATRRADAEVERLTRELATERRLDVAAQEALRADVAREIAANKKLEAELAEARAALATKGATDRLAERVETIAAALPDELDQRVRACIAARPGRDLAFVLKNGCDRLEASDGYQDRQKAARKARS